LDDVAWRRELAAEDQGRRQRRLLEGEAAQADLLGIALAQEPRSPLPVDALRRELVGAISHEHQQWTTRSVAGELADHLEAQLVRPVEIVEEQERGAVDRLEDPVGDRPDDQAPGPERV